MGKKSDSLGRGLSAIFKDHANDGLVASTEGVRIVKIPIGELDPNPFQPRRVFDEAEINELAETIKEHGLIQPVTVRKHDGRYQLVSGERRLRAANVAGLGEIEARVFEMLSDKSMAEWAIIENVQRVDLNPVEVANSYEMLIENHGYTHEDLAKRLGKSRSAVTNSLRLLKLPGTVLLWIEEGKLSAGHARSLLSPDISDPEKAARQIIEGKLNVRQAEKIKSPKSTKQIKTSQDLGPHLSKIIADIQYGLGTRVRIQGKTKDMAKGSIHVEYESLEDLARIRDLVFQAST